MTVLARKCLVCLWAVCLVIAFSNYVAAATLTFNPSTSTVGIGDQIGIDINVSGLEDVDLGSFDLNLNYDDTVLSFDSNVLGDGLGAFCLSTVFFTGSAVGTSSLSFSDVCLGDDLGDSIDASLETGSVTVIPVPATIWFLGFGLIGLVGFRRNVRN